MSLPLRAELGEALLDLGAAVEARREEEGDLVLVRRVLLAAEGVERLREGEPRRAIERRYAHGLLRVLEGRLRVAAGEVRLGERVERGRRGRRVLHDALREGEGLI